ncbi:MAG: hypothetical protein MSH55_04300 [Enorma sp.]|uniref:hypothetical protein n=1 Tax=Enorma sp. TaxID=1920692 RepID=UPI0025838C09|nr:hypothetical protein [Enorma sp.]MCI7774986.1 hypothetical protein [Enorma sp.]
MVDDFDTKIDGMENEQDGVLEGAADVDAPASDPAAATANEVDAPEGTATADAPEDAGAAADDAPRIPEFLQHPATGAAPRTSQVVDEEPVPTEEAPGASPVEAVGSFFSEGAAAVREMSAARKAHAEAREQLEQLDATIADEEAELAHRREVAANYHAIISSETARRDGATKAEQAAEVEQARIQGEIDALKERLQQMKDADSQTEKRLKAALDAAEAREASSRENGARLQRRLDDAKRNLEKAEEDQKNGVAAAQAAVESAESRLAMLHDEYAEVQRNPSANSAAYSVRADELQTEISDAAHELQSARDDLPRITKELEDALAHARKAVSEAEKPMDDAKQAFREVSSAADEARNTYREAKDDATERQRKLKEEISGKEKERRAQEQAAEDARAEASEAQALIDEANDIHAHPEVTETIAARLEADRAEREEQAVEVEQLASTEKAVRERTRGSRARFIGAIVGIVVLVVAVIALVIVFMNR